MKHLHDDLHQEARRRASSLTDQQWTAWLADVTAHNGTVTLPIGDGIPIATYPRVKTASKSAIFEPAVINESSQIQPDAHDLASDGDHREPTATDEPLPSFYEVDGSSGR